MTLRCISRCVWPMADEQPLQAHLQNKPAKKPYAKKSGTARCRKAATGCELSKPPEAAN